MDINLVQEELMKRYLYLYDNKELVLALCINYGIRENYYKEQIKKKNELKKSLKRKSKQLKSKLDKTMTDPEIYHLILSTAEDEKNLNGTVTIGEHGSNKEVIVTQGLEHMAMHQGMQGTL